MQRGRLKSSLLEPRGDAGSQGHLQVLLRVRRRAIDQFSEFNDVDVRDKGRQAYFAVHHQLQISKEFSNSAQLTLNSQPSSDDPISQRSRATGPVMDRTHFFSHVAQTAFVLFPKL